jgi:hypothetical protein
LRKRGSCARLRDASEDNARNLLVQRGRSNGFLGPVATQRLLHSNVPGGRLRPESGMDYLLCAYGPFPPPSAAFWAASRLATARRQRRGLEVCVAGGYGCPYPKNDLEGGFLSRGGPILAPRRAYPNLSYPTENRTSGKACAPLSQLIRPKIEPRGKLAPCPPDAARNLRSTRSKMRAVRGTWRRC